MELAGAVKDGDCDKVAVKGGISLDRGCCNYFWPKARTVIKFTCGTCEHHEDQKRDSFYGA